MYFNIIASGSKGNATLIKDKDVLILIDMGISFERLQEGLKEIDCDFNDISIALFTHEHSDHVKGIKFLSPKIMYGLKGTLPSLSNVLNPYEEFKYKHLSITPVSTSHDAKNPCGDGRSNDNEKLVYMTDTGMLVDKSRSYMLNPTYLIIESNHDMRMEMKSSRPLELKQRVLSDYGHLCNEDSAFITIDLLGPNTKEIVLAHLSEDCNTEEKALAAYVSIFKYKNIRFDKYYIHCARQYESTLGGNLDER